MSIKPKITLIISKPIKQQIKPFNNYNNALNAKLVGSGAKNAGKPAETKIVLSQTRQMTDRDRMDLVVKANRMLLQLPLLLIKKSVIGTYSYEDSKRIGTIKITNGSFTGTGSVNDPRMGPLKPTDQCAKCGQFDCPGHYGFIDFGEFKIYNPAWIRHVVAVLVCVCNDCAELLITEDIIKEKGFDKLCFDKRLPALEEYCKGNKCHNKKIKLGMGDIINCHPNPTYLTSDLKEKGQISFKKHANKKGRGAQQDKDNKIQIRPITKAIDILSRISDSTARLLGFSKESSPINMIQGGILVCPNIARPPIEENGNEHHDQLTYSFSNIFKKVDGLKDGRGTVEDLYSEVKKLYFGNGGKKLGGREYVSIIERLQGKTSLMRGLSMGKRGDYSARTVAGTDPSLKFGQIRIPKVWACVLTKRITVTNFNIEHLQVLLNGGQITHTYDFGVNLRSPVNMANQLTNPRILKIGDKVERWLENGDRIIINRQPTLHKSSMMAYSVVLGEELTIGLHLYYTTPMNCDFDGDENNAWLPRDFEVEAEAEYLINVKNNLMSPEQNRPNMGLVMNSISAAYLLTYRKLTIDLDLFSELISLITQRKDLPSLKARLNKYGVKENSGQALFSALLPADFFYRNKGIIIIEGILIHGAFKKSNVGVSHRSIVQDLYKAYGSERVAEFFTDASWVLNKWIYERGFSVGILDMVNLKIDPKTKLEYDVNERVLKRELETIYLQLEALSDKCDDKIEEEYRIKRITNISNVSNGIGTKLANDVLTIDNSIAVMTEKGAGTKGAVANIGQMMGSVGQQFYHGERLALTIADGTKLFPCYDRNDPSPEAHAFIPRSFWAGLTPQDLFCLHSGGRESLLDTALKTADVGTIQHRMTKALENIIIAYDSSVRNTNGTMFQPMYNIGYAVEELMMVSEVLSSFIDIKALVEQLNIKYGFIPKDVAEKVVDLRAANNITEFKSVDKVDKVRVEINPNRLDKHEKTRIIGARAVQLANGGKPMVDIGKEIDFVRIASKEYNAGVLPIYVVRRMPDGEIDKVYPTLENI